MLSASEIKRKAKATLHPALGIGILLCFLYTVINSAIGIIPVAVFILSGVLTYGCATAFLILRRTQTLKIEYLFSGFNNFVTVMCANLLTSLYTTLWSFLFIIPGIVKTYSYSMTNYIIHDNPGISASDAIKESRRMMNGHKADLFVLHLSVWGWIYLIMLGLFALMLVFQLLVPVPALFAIFVFLIIIFTLVMSLFVVPYVMTCNAIFYEDLKGTLNDTSFTENTSGEAKTEESTAETPAFLPESTVENETAETTDREDTSDTNDTKDVESLL